MEKWYRQPPHQGDIGISTRVRLARNVKQFPFKEKISSSGQIQLNQMVKSALKRMDLGHNKFGFIELQELSELERIALLEQNLVSRTFLTKPENRMLVLSEDHSVSIMVNEEDHIRIQVLRSGMDLEGAYQLCNKIDDILSETLDFAFDDTLGYLTVSPTNLGTGLRASVLLHLPALERIQIIPQLMKTVSRMGLVIRGSYGEETGVIGSAYQIANQVTLGLSEQMEISNLQNIVRQVMESERGARADILNNIEVIDEICRSYGILKYARMITSKEAYAHLSNVRLGVSERILEEVSLETLNQLLNSVGEATLSVRANQHLNARERDLDRARLIRDLI